MKNIDLTRASRRRNRNKLRAKSSEFNKMASFLESVNINRNIMRRIERIFPRKLRAMIRSLTTEQLLNAKVGYSREYDSLAKKYIKGIPFDVYECKVNLINMMTIVGTDLDRRIPNTILSKWLAEIETKTDDSAHDSNVENALKDMKIKNKNGVVHVKNWNLKNTFPILTFSGFNKLLNEEQYIGVVLHEIGHHTQKYSQRLDFLWSLMCFVLVFLLSLSPAGQKMKSFVFEKFNSSGRGNMGDFLPIIVIIILFNLLLNILLSMYQTPKHTGFEYASDKFAKDAGYGKELASALELLEREGKKQMIKEERKQNAILRAILKAINKIFEFLYKIKAIPNTHPDTDSRIEILNSAIRDSNLRMMLLNKEEVRTDKEVDNFINASILKIVKDGLRNI